VIITVKGSDALIPQGLRETYESFKNENENRGIKLAVMAYLVNLQAGNPLCRPFSRHVPLGRGLRLYSISSEHSISFSTRSSQSVPSFF
jgi:hypothetical protein